MKLLHFTGPTDEYIILTSEPESEWDSLKRPECKLKSVAQLLFDQGGESDLPSDRELEEVQLD